QYHARVLPLRLEISDVFQRTPDQILSTKKTDRVEPGGGTGQRIGDAGLSRVEDRFGLAQGLFEAIVADRLDDEVDRVAIEGFDGELRVAGHEDHGTVVVEVPNGRETGRLRKHHVH